MDNNELMILIKKAQAGDTTAENSVLLQHLGLVRIIARPYFLIGADKEDLYQIGTIGLMNAVRKYDENCNASFKTFASRCIKNTILDELRKTKNLSDKIKMSSMPVYDLPPSDEDAETDPETNYIQKEDAEILLSAISDVLNPVENNVLKLYLNEMSYSEISAKLGMEKKKVDNTIYAAKKKIKKLLRARSQS